MNIFKLSIGSRFHRFLSVNNYEADTKKRFPYYQIGTDGKMRHFAICPGCNNPIQIIGVEGRPDNMPHPYGKHYASSVVSLAPYSQEDFDGCPLAAKNSIAPDKTAKKTPASSLPAEILSVLRKDFDRVALVIQKAIGIKITVNLAERMLINYLAEEGFRYKHASLVNIPWIFAYMSDSQSLFGRVVQDENLRTAITDSVPNAVFTNNNQLSVAQSSTGKKEFLDINFCLMHHAIAPVNREIQESLKLVVSYKDKDIFEKKIIFDYEQFQSLLAIPDGKGFRNSDLLDLAAKTITND